MNINKVVGLIIMTGLLLGLGALVAITVNNEIQRSNCVLSTNFYIEGTCHTILTENDAILRIHIIADDPQDLVIETFSDKSTGRDIWHWDHGTLSPIATTEVLEGDVSVHPDGSFAVYVMEPYPFSEQVYKTEIMQVDLATNISEGIAEINNSFNIPHFPDVNIFGEVAFAASENENMNVYVYSNGSIEAHDWHILGQDEEDIPEWSEDGLWLRWTGVMSDYYYLSTENMSISNLSPNDIDWPTTDSRVYFYTGDLYWRENTLVYAQQ